MNRAHIAARGDLEIVITRTFKAPRRLVFEAFAKPELVRRWLLGPDGWTMTVCEIDLRAGGAYRYVWRNQKGVEMGMGGVFLEVAPPDRIVSTEKFDQAWYPGEAVGTVELAEREPGVTTLTQTIRYESSDARNAVLKSPMEEGLGAGYNRLEQMLLLATPA